MSTSKLVLPVAGFTDGLNTEASILNVMPSEFMNGTINVELLSNGSARRRRGVDFIGLSSTGNYMHTVRSGNASAETYIESPAVTSVKLAAPNGNIVKRVVVDINNSFEIFEATSSGLKNCDVPYGTLARTTDSHSNQKFFDMDYAYSGKRLYFAGRHTKPGYLYVDADNVTLAATYIDVLIRDTDATAANKRVSNNSKWYECIDAHTATAADEPGVGANWKVYWVQLDGPIPTSTAAWSGTTVYTSTIIKQYDKNTTPGATDTYPSTTAFFASRLWLAGDPKTPNSVYFSKTIVGTRDIEKFYQFADPFDSNDPNVVDSDGGVIQIQGAGVITKLLTIGTVLLVCTTNGIWEVRGASDIFKATEYQVSKVLNDAVLGVGSAVAVDQEAIVFGSASVWLTEINSNITDIGAGGTDFFKLDTDKIETIYDAIPRSDKASARAIYSQSEHKVWYFFNSGETAFTNSYGAKGQPSYFTDVLSLDTRFTEAAVNVDPNAPKRSVKGAFTQYTYADGGKDGEPYIAYPFVTEEIPAANSQVVVGTNTVVDDSGNLVVTTGAVVGRRCACRCYATYYIGFGGDN